MIIILCAEYAKIKLIIELKIEYYLHKNKQLLFVPELKILNILLLGTKVFIYYILIRY